MSTASKHPRFVARVRAEMIAQSLTIRGLARKMDPQNAERARRNLHRWLDEGITPSRASRAEVAAALGVAEQSLDGAGEDDEEADLPSALHRIVSAIVRREIRGAA